MADIITLPALRFDDRQIDIMRRTIGNGVPPAEFEFFLEVALNRGLNPFNREIHPVMRGGRLTIQTGIDGFRKLADETGLYRGQEGPYFCGKDGLWVDAWLEDGPPIAARVGILREGFDGPIWAVARYKSYVQTDRNGNVQENWNKFPDVMLSKCAEALAFRKTFPSRLGGLYVHEEMMQADSGSASSRRVSAPSLKALHIKGYDAGLWPDVPAFYEFCSAALARQVSPENGKSVTSEERTAIEVAIEKAIAKKLSAVTVEAVPEPEQEATEKSSASQPDSVVDSYISLDEISQELAEKKSA